jgi:transcription elongation factor Elf1
MTEDTCSYCGSENTITVWRVDMETESWVDVTTCGDCGQRTIEWTKPGARART